MPKTKKARASVSACWSNFRGAGRTIAGFEAGYLPIVQQCNHIIARFGIGLRGQK